MVDKELKLNKTEQKQFAWAIDDPTKLIVRNKNGVISVTEISDFEQDDNYLIFDSHVDDKKIRRSDKQFDNFQNVNSFRELSVDRFSQNLFLYTCNMLDSQKKIIAFCNELVFEKGKKVIFIESNNIEKILFPSNSLNEELLKKTDTLVINDFCPTKKNHLISFANLLRRSYNFKKNVILLGKYCVDELKRYVENNWGNWAKPEINNFINIINQIFPSENRFLI